MSHLEGIRNRLHVSISTLKPTKFLMQRALGLQDHANLLGSTYRKHGVPGSGIEPPTPRPECFLPLYLPRLLCWRLQTEGRWGGTFQLRLQLPADEFGLHLLRVLLRGGGLPLRRLEVCVLRAGGGAGGPLGAGGGHRQDVQREGGGDAGGASRGRLGGA